MSMSGPVREGAVTPELDRRRLWRRMAAFMCQTLRGWSCLSAVGPFVSSRLDRETADAPPDLDSQLEEILDCIRRQEQIWRLERRI